MQGPRKRLPPLHARQAGKPCAVCLYVPALHPKAAQHRLCPFAPHHTYTHAGSPTRLFRHGPRPPPSSGRAAPWSGRCRRSCPTRRGCCPKGHGPAPWAARARPRSRSCPCTTSRPPWCPACPRNTCGSGRPAATSFACGRARGRASRWVGRRSEARPREGRWRWRRRGGGTREGMSRTAAVKGPGRAQAGLVVRSKRVNARCAGAARLVHGLCIGKASRLHSYPSRMSSPPDHHVCMQGGAGVPGQDGTGYWRQPAAAPGPVVQLRLNEVVG